MAVEIPSSTLPLRTLLRDGILQLEEFLRRVEALVERQEPVVQALLPTPDRFHRLRRQARDMARRYPDPQGRPPLFGMLVAVKDIFHVVGFPTRAGSRLPPEVLVGPEAATVRRLIEAGGLVLGKTVTTEFAYFPPGPTTNPHNPAHTPGGSSSGSAAAVAAGYCPLALGSQTIGSVIRPAAFCGVAGFKPSYDRVSRQGVIPLSPSLDHVGFFAPDVAGLQLAAWVLCADWRPLHPEAPPVLGIPEGPYLSFAEPAGLKHFRHTCRALEQTGFELRSVPALTDFEEIQRRHSLILEAEAARVHEAWYSAYPDRYHPTNAALIERGRSHSDRALADALAGRANLRRVLADQMAAHSIDLWISPAAPGPAPPGLESTGNPVMNLPWTQAGLPTLGIPSGVSTDGLPLGLQITAGWQGDEALLGWGEQLEAALV